jgi:hypothetical protein
MTCADLQTLFDLREGELTERVAGELRAHLEGCARCAALARRLDRMVAAIGSDLAPAATISVESVMASLARPEVKPKRPSRAPWAAGAMAASMLAAVGVTLAVAYHGEKVTARGAAPAQDALEKHVGVTVLAGEPLVALHAGAAVAADSGFALSYRNLGATDAYAMVFLVDSSGELHWVYPAYTDAAQDPLSVKLLPASSDRVLPETVRFDDLAKGSGKIVTVLSAAPLRVKDVEAGRAPSAVVRSVPITVR